MKLGKASVYRALNALEHVFLAISHLAYSSYSGPSVWWRDWVGHPLTPRLMRSAACPRGSTLSADRDAGAPVAAN